MTAPRPATCSRWCGQWVQMWYRASAWERALATEEANRDGGVGFARREHLTSWTMRSSRAGEHHRSFHPDAHLCTGAGRRACRRAGRGLVVIEYPTHPFEDVSIVGQCQLVAHPRTGQLTADPSG